MLDPCICVEPDEISTIISDKIVKAKKTHICIECLEEIMYGEDDGRHTIRSNDFPEGLSWDYNDDHHQKVERPKSALAKRPKRELNL